MTQNLIAWFETLSIRDVGRVGGKNASLGEMVRALEGKGVRVPGGFATTAAAFREYVSANGLEPDLRRNIDALKSGKLSLHATGEAIRRLFLDAEFPQEISNAITHAYRELSKRSHTEDISVAVRSSATAEDLPQASFAGQQETFLNVRGERALLDACRRCYASLFTDRAISYREVQGLEPP